MLSKLINLPNIQTPPSSTSNAELVPATTLIKDSLIKDQSEPKTGVSDSSSAATNLKSGNTAETFKPVKHEMAFQGSVLKSMITNFDARQVSNAVLTKEQVLRDARSAGLSDREVRDLEARLDRMSPEERSAELEFLNKNVTNSPNADRALRTYLKLSRMKDEHPQRITSDIVHTLTRGVAERRTSSSTGQEGILGQQQALDAAEAMTRMSQTDYDHLRRTLDQAGNRYAYTRSNPGITETGSQPSGSPASSSTPWVVKKNVSLSILTERLYNSGTGLTVTPQDPEAAAQAEKALILKSVAARKDSLANPSASGSTPSPAMSDIMNYAGEIRGRSRDRLISSSTVLDLKDDGKAGALQQRFKDSCVPTTAQIARAEADPIYAWKLHQEAIHSLQASGSGIAQEQKELLQGEGGIAVSRQPTTANEVIKEAIFKSKGVPAVGTERILDKHVGPYSNINYKFNGVMDSKQSRVAALNEIADLVEQGIDVPIAVAWNGGGGHVMLVTDVRGSGDNQRFLITDPLAGTSTWISRKAIVDGNTTFAAGGQAGRLNEFFSPDVPDYKALGIKTLS